jgi:uncharacterized membrane protein YphA (DoxX/SURF4 family)
MKKENIIQYAQLTFRVVLGLLLIIAGYLKIQDNSALFESVAYITWMPMFIKSLIIDLLPWVEVLVGALLMLNLLGGIVKPAAALIYFSFFAFAIYGLGTGIEGDCGCFGDPESGSILATLLGSEFGWQMVIRNGIFLGMAAFICIPKSRFSPKD